MELPSTSIKETTSRAEQITLGLNDIPWAAKSVEVPLTLVTLKDGAKFYLGSAVRGKKLTQITGELKKTESKLAQADFYNNLPDFIKHGSRHVFQVQVPKSALETYYVKISAANKMRTFFLRSDNLHGLPVIIKIAVCRKNQEIEVLKEISNTSKQR